MTTTFPGTSESIARSVTGNGWRKAAKMEEEPSLAMAACLLYFCSRRASVLFLSPLVETAGYGRVANMHLLDESNGRRRAMERGCRK